MAHQRGTPHGGHPKPHVDSRLPKHTPNSLPRAPKRPIVSRPDERGVPYPGDWPNPLGGKTKGCF